MIVPAAESSARTVTSMLRRVRIVQEGRLRSAIPAQARSLSSTIAVQDERDSTAGPKSLAPASSSSQESSTPSESPSPPSPAGTQGSNVEHPMTDEPHVQYSSWAHNVVVNARATNKAEDQRRLEAISDLKVGTSRDMSESAESSYAGRTGARNSRHSYSTETNEENRQFAQLFDTLREKWTKPTQTATSSSSPPQTISSKLSFDAFATPSPRKGVHGRQQRSAGQTPKEAQAFNEILAGIFADSEFAASSGPRFGPSSRRTTGRSGGFGVSDPYAATRSGGGGFGLSGNIGDGAKVVRRFFEREDPDDESVEELEMLQEEMACIASDVELLEWAKNRVFKPVTTPAPTAGGSSATSNSPPMLTFAPTYPKILAHLLKTIRVHYNNPHLVLSLFNHAQTSSLESYLSGCLTGAYNEVLTVRWESFKDLTGLENGIKEMEMVGVSWNDVTVRLVSKVVEEVSKDLLPSPVSTSSSSSSFGSIFQQENQATGGFSNLAGLTKGRKYGPDVLERLGKLEKKVQRDVRQQAKQFENMQKKKKIAREERERRLERDRREGGGEIVEPDGIQAEGDRAYL